MGKSFLFLLLALQSVLAADVGLRRLCRSPHLDSPTETKEPKSRFKKGACTQTFPYAGTPEQHETFCRSRMPYDATVVKRTDTSVTCKWKVMTTRCDHSKKKRVYQINEKCFTVKNDCSKEGLSRAKPATVDHLRWLSIFYRNSETALRVEASKAFNLRKELRYDNGNVLKGAKGDKKAMVIQRLTPFGLFPGDLLPSESSKLRELCLANTKVSGTAASPLFSIPFGTGDGEEERKKIGSGSVYTKFPLTAASVEVGFAFITRNDYTPQFADDGLVDLDHFHKQCEKICTDCFAASFETFVEYQSQMPEGRFYAPAGRRDPTHDGACSSQFKMENRKRFNVKPSTHKSSKAYVPKGRHWWNGDKDSLNLPTASCADQIRTAVQLVHSDTLTYVDVPSFDRHPIVCISGPEAAAVEKEGECFPNSKMSNGKCVCKDTYEDALEIDEFRQEVLNLGFKENGQICIKPQSCSEKVQSPLTGVIFLFDGSKSIKAPQYQLGVNFVESFKDIIPNDVPILFYQFAEYNRKAFLEKGWTKKQYIKQMTEALGVQKCGGTRTYAHMKFAMNAVQKWGKEKKILIIITDGKATDYKEKNAEKIFEQREEYNYETIYITIGAGVDEKIELQESDSLWVTIYGIDDYSGLDDTLRKAISQTICTPWPEGHLMKAIYGDDWKEAT